MQGKNFVEAKNGLGLLYVSDFWTQFDIKDTILVYFNKQGIQCGTLSNLHSDNVKIVSFNFYPNPAHDLLTVDPGANKQYTIKLINALGKVVYNSYGNGKHTISVSSYPNGIYFLSLSNSPYIRPGLVKLKKQMFPNSTG